MAEEFIPPSVLAESSYISHVYHSSVPKSIVEDIDAPCILGVDEAGRGPVIGPMVYAIAYCREDYKDTLAEKGFDDSKVLKHETRSKLLQSMCTVDADAVENIGWGVFSLSAQDISSGMLRPKSMSVDNLNNQAHETTMALIQQVLDQGVKLSHVYVDTVGPPISYQAKLSRRFPEVKFTVAKKADSIYPIVSAASICAKVTRDAIIKLHDESDGTWGSGYPSDGKTSAYLKNSVHPLWGWKGQIRFSWQTVTDVLNKNDGILVEWTDDYEQSTGRLSEFFTGNISSPLPKGMPVTTEWFGIGNSQW